MKWSDVKWNDVTSSTVVLKPAPPDFLWKKVGCHRNPRWHAFYIAGPHYVGQDVYVPDTDGGHYHQITYKLRCNNTFVKHTQETITSRLPEGARVCQKCRMLVTRDIVES